MSIPPFADLNILRKSLRFLYKTNTLRKFFFSRINWVLIYGPPRTGTSLLARLLSYQSKSMFVDVGLHFAESILKVQNGVRNYLENIIKTFTLIFL